MPKGLLLSLLFHFGITILLVISLPNLFTRKLALNNEYVIVADVVPIAEITNIKVKAIPDSGISKTALKTQPSATKETPKSSPEKQTSFVDNAESVPDAKNNKITEQSNKKSVKEKKTPDDDFNKTMLKSIESAKKKRKQKKVDQDFDKLAEGLNAKTNKEHSNNLPLSLSEKDAIINRIQRRWNKAAFSGASEKMNGEVIIDLDSGGNVIKIRRKSFTGNAQYKQVYFESLERAIMTAGPYIIRDRELEVGF